MYQLTLHDFKIPLSLETFKGSNDQKDVESFIHDFHERLSLLGATDGIMCRIFSTCLTGEAWDWYKTLSPGSIRSFDDFTDLFLERYSHIKIPWVTVESLLDMKQSPTEWTRAYIYRFTRVMRNIENYSDELALIALQRGLRNGGPDTLKYDSYQKNCITFNKLLSFAKGYIRGEDNTEPPRRSSRSPSPRARKGYNLTRRDNRPWDFQDEESRDGHKWGKLNLDAEYRSHFTSYAQFDQPTKDLLKLISHKFDLSIPIDI
jgi:Retrotransposon gag protein